MGESSSKSVISVNSNQRSVTVPEEKTRAVLVSDNIQQKSHLNDKGSRVKLTLQDYRKQVGLKVINQKSTQKIGITVSFLILCFFFYYYNKKTSFFRLNLRQI